MKCAKLFLFAFSIAILSQFAVASDVPVIHYSDEFYTPYSNIDVGGVAEPGQEPEPVVPEPATIALVGLGLAAGGMISRRKI